MLLGQPGVRERDLGLQGRVRGGERVDLGVGLPRARFSAFSSAGSITAWSASSRSARTSATSDAGFASGPKHRTTIASASASRSFAIPWAEAVPPGTSTNPTCAWTVLRERSISVRTSTRGSGTGTIAWFACPP